MIPNDTIQILRCSQNDTALRKWSFELYANDTQITPQGTYYLVCENGETVSLTINGTSLDCDCTADLSANPGRFLCKIKNEYNNELLYSSLIILEVEVRP